MASSEEASGANAPEAALPTAALQVEGPCEILHVALDGAWMLVCGSDGKLASVEASAGVAVDDKETPGAGSGTAVAPNPSSSGMRPWTMRLVPPRAALTAAAISHDRSWLATGQETEEGFGVWIHQLEPRTARPTGVPKLVARFTLAVRHLVWHPSQPLLGIAADDGKLCVWDRAAEGPGGDVKARRRDFPASSGGGVRCVAFDPLGQLLAAALSSGALLVCSLRDAKEVAKQAHWPKAAIGSEQITMEWSPDGEWLALPGEPSVRLVRRGSLSERAASRPLSLDGGHKNSTSAVAWAQEGSLLASASRDAIALWFVVGASARLARTCALDAPPWSLRWSGGRFLYASTRSGTWARLTAPADLPAAEIAAAADVATSQREGAEVHSDATQASGTAPSGVDAIPETGEAAGAEEAIGRHPVLQLGATGLDPKASSSRSRRRYLAWNEHGALKFFGPQRQAGTSAGKVVVEYSRDRGRAAAREVRAPAGLALGALGPGLFALAANPTAAHRAKVMVHVASPSGKTCFEYSVPRGELVEAVAVARQFVAVFTSPLSVLRVLSVTGLPLGILACSGSVVGLAAHEDLLLCVTQPPRGRALVEAALDYALYGVSAKERLSTGRLPISPKSRLRWIGFSSDGMPLALDTMGVLRALALNSVTTPTFLPCAEEWLPVAELPHQGKRSWPVRVEEDALACADVPKEEDEPSFSNPKVQDAKFRLPFSVVSDGTEALLRNAFLSAHARFAQGAGLVQTRRRPTAQGRSFRPSARPSLGRQALKLFDTLARSGEVEQALDLLRRQLRASDVMSDRHRSGLVEEARRLAQEANRDALAAAVVALSVAGQDSSEEPPVGAKRGFEEAMGGLEPDVADEPSAQRMRIA